MKKNIIILVLAVFSHLAKAQGYLVLDSLTGTSGGIKINADIQPWNVQTSDIQCESQTVNGDINVTGGVNANVVNAATVVSSKITSDGNLNVTSPRDNTSTLILGNSGGAVEGVVNQSAAPIKIIPNYTNGKGNTAIELYSRSRSSSSSGGENSAVRQALIIPSDYPVIPYVWDTLGYFEISNLNEVNAYLRIGATSTGEGVTQAVQSDVSILWVHSGTYNIVKDIQVKQIATISTDTNRVATLMVDVKEDMNPSGYPRVYVRAKVLSDLADSYNRLYIATFPNLGSNKFILK